MPPRSSFVLRTGTALAFALLAGASCSSDDGSPESEGKPTGAECPSESPLTYDTFGREFFQQYCLACHSSTGTVSGGHAFDTLAEIRESASHIDEYAAAGPEATNRVMPPQAPRPSDEGRLRLGEWIACGAP